MIFLYVAAVLIPSSENATCERSIGYRTRRVFEGDNMPSLSIALGGTLCGKRATWRVAVDTILPYLSAHFLWVAQCEEHAADLRKLHKRRYNGTAPAGFFGYDPACLEQDPPQGDSK